MELQPRTNGKRRRKKTGTKASDPSKPSGKKQAPTANGGKKSQTKTASADKKKTTSTATPKPPTTTAAAAAVTVATTATALPSSNNYVTEVQKKLRNITKKLKRANITAAKQKEGATLTEQQVIQLQRLTDLQTQHNEWSSLLTTFLTYAATSEKNQKKTEVVAPATTSSSSSSSTTTTTKSITTTKSSTSAGETKETTETLKKKKKKNQSQSQSNKKESVKDDMKQTTTRTLTADTGASFPPAEEIEKDSASSVILDDVLKLLTISNLVKSYEGSCAACAQVIACSNILCGGALSSSQEEKEKEEERSIDEMLMVARNGAQRLASQPETARVLRAVNGAIKAVRIHEEMKNKVKELGGDEFNFFAAEEEEDEQKTKEIAADALRRALA